MAEKVIVFGGSGFLGSHVCDVLTKRGYDVTIFDKKKSSWINKNQQMVIGDICNYEEVNNVIKYSDYVYNFAGISDLNEGINKPIQTIEVNVLGNANILESSKINNIKQFLFASSIYIFSHLGSFYRCSKQSCENYIEEYGRQYNLNYNIMRYGSLYGPRSDQSNGVYRLIKKSIEKSKVLFQDDIRTIREYINVHDAAEASVDIINDHSFFNKAVMISGETAIKSSELAKKVANYLNIEFVIADKSTDNEYRSSHYIDNPHTYEPPTTEKFPIKNQQSIDSNIFQLIEDIKSQLK